MKEDFYGEWTMEDAVMFTLLSQIYKRCDRVETQHYPNSTVLVFTIAGERNTITVSNKVLEAIKDKLEEE